ncbi:glycine betaine ABC transporter substrate-binding protein [Balneola vulgaris]|uniref:ABC transporter permease/substrate-binding protein n=1 Tax=Balneola vulgaris TaxID=287535 RepID=UPI0003715A71|nr:glycine betaine ABC transporter substrate-binding protein [Balneola vulgaris]
MRIACISLVLGLFLPIAILAQDNNKEVVIGSKLFTESVIIGEITNQLLIDNGYQTQYKSQLGGTRILWNALLEGEIDIYPDYTGTIIQEILNGQNIDSHQALNEVLKPYQVQATKSLGFNNSYAIGVNKETATQRGLKTISDLAKHPDLKLGFSNEFLDRNDGWKGLSEAYNLPHQQVTGLDHDLAYRGLEAGNIDAIDLYSTDAEIQYYDLAVLEDDQGFFPDYQAIILYRMDIDESMVSLLESLEGTITESEMVALNAQVKLEGESDEQVAANFLDDKFSIKSEVVQSTVWSRLWINTLGHLYLVGISLTLAIIVAIPLGIAAVKNSWLEGPLLAFVGVLQTIPSLALLVFMIPLLGIGSLPAMAALFLYSLLPIVRNTHSGIKEIPASVQESAWALGLSNRFILRKIELPLAKPTILAGIKTSAVINVGTATLGALIGAEGYGQPILTGIRLDDTALILEGAIPAALMALLVQWSFDLYESKFSN